MNSVFMSNVLQNLNYRLVYGFFWLLSLLPMAVLYVISDFIYLIVYYVVRYRRNVVRQNIAGSFPDKDKAYLTEVERGFYHFFCDYIVENIKLFSMSKKEMMKRMTFSGLDDAFGVRQDLIGGEALASSRSLYLMRGTPQAAPKCFSGSTSYLRV